MSPSLFENVPVGIPLSQYTIAINNTVARARELAGVWVIAELSDVRLAGGHCYMELIEKNEFGQTVAKLRANIWRTSYNQLRQKFFNATQREISNGIKALVRGSATHHSLYGLSFNIIDIDPSYTMGDMERIRREILMKLHKEGVAMFNKSLSFPIAPQKIAVISAEGAAGYGDFINHLCANSEGFVFYPCLFPCIMQGEKVSESIRRALQIIESTSHLWDCVAIVRGGGATTDLNGFDDYELAKAVATCGLPVVVGIGHERDRNVLDDIAHTSLKTPTAVAGFFIDRARTAYDKVLTLADRLRIYSTDLLRGEERRLSTIQGFIPQLALRKLDEAKSNLQSITGKLPILSDGRIGKENIRLDGVISLIGNSTLALLSKENLKLDNLSQTLKSISGNQINQSSQKINNLESLLKVLDPKNTLNRGYSITRLNGKAVKSKDSIPPGAILTTTLAEGEVRSMVIKENP
ncbi:MAG: exodeoxyribonuclease VII large subunit [Muribaculaceae bacterium]|nr:exodeoxyribonuclease VII large subunit [Muribaculaceae bacterium]